MNLRRKSLHLVDLRVQQHLTNERSLSSRLGRVHSIESLMMSNHSDFKHTAPLAKMTSHTSL